MRIEDAVPDPAAALEHLRSQVQACTACELHRCSERGLVGSGEIPAPVMIVDGAPQHAEAQATEPLLDDRGTLPDAALRTSGLEFVPRFVTYAVKHPTCEGAPAGDDGQPTDEQLEACRPWFEHELALVDPDVVILLGPTAVRAAAGIIGRAIDPAAERGRVIEGADRLWLVTSADPSTGSDETHTRDLVADLRAVRDLVTPDPGS